MSKSGYSFFLSSWDKNQTEIKRIREKVFINEMGLSAENVESGSDSEYYHVIAYDGDNQPIGTGCIHPSGQLGKIAVVKEKRGLTVGKAILIYLLQIARTLHLPNVWVDAYESTTGFYESKKFKLTDKTTHDQGIACVKMIHELESRKTIH
jgi:predicted GNAT family N-acyltransferase